MPNKPEDWWKTSEYVGVDTWDIPAIITEAERRAKLETWEEVIKLSNEIELDMGTPDFNEWRAFKRLRNTLRDRIQQYGKQE